jgi:hypothetical protein
MVPLLYVSKQTASGNITPFFSLLIIAIVVFLTMGGVIGAQSSVQKDIEDAQKIKSAFIYNFTKYIKWPEETRNFEICLTGGDTFGGRLNIIEKASNAKHTYTIEKNVPVDAIAQCEVLLVDKYLPIAELEAYIKAVKRHNVLTISDIPNFIEQGGMIGFVSEQKKIGVFERQKIRFEINKKIADSADLKISSELLELAVRVK